MVQTRRTTDGPQSSQSQQPQGGDGILPILPQGDNFVLPTVLPRWGVDNNYNDDTAADGS